MKKINKIVIIMLLMLTLSGCTTVLKDSENKAIVDSRTGKSVTENILCQPTDEKIIKIYKENKVDISNLPSCDNMKLIGTYEGLWENFFVRPLAYIIINIGAILKSTVLSIIVVTIFIRILLYPVTKKTALQSENMKKAQPELGLIEKKYANKTDSESISKKGQETMAIYKKYSISPLSGCVFALIQIPLLFAFLEAINRVPAIFEETFFHFQMGTTPSVAISNGNYYYLILNILIIFTTYYSFKMNQSSISPDMQKSNKIMMIFMIVFISFVSFTLPTAVAVYWIFSSLFTIFQNIITDRNKKKNA